MREKQHDFHANPFPAVNSSIGGYDISLPFCAVGLLVLTDFVGGVFLAAIHKRIWRSQCATYQ
jgi:hypothetical protein